jgi:hypothetical protein
MIMTQREEEGDDLEDFAREDNIVPKEGEAGPFEHL